MKPKNDLQKKVLEYAKQIPKLTSDQENYGYFNCFKHSATLSKSGTLCCLECGKKWKSDSELSSKILGVNCPDCKYNLHVKTTQKRNFKETCLYTVIDKFNGFQVIRLIQLYATYSAGKKAEYHYRTLYHVWINPDGISTIYGLFITSTFNETWGGDYEIRNMDNSTPYNVHTKVIYNKIPAIKELKRNGFKGFLHGLNPYYLFTELLKNRVYETLWKAKFYRVLYYHDSGYTPEENVKKYFSSIKICIRNNYEINDPTTYFDYLGFLDFLGKDLHNPKYVCPENLKKEHNRFLKKKNVLQEELELQKKKEQLLKDNEEYLKSKGKFFGLNFMSGDLCIKVLESVDEFIDEAKHHKHCVYRSSYYKREDSLILSASYNNKKVETIELSLKTFQIIQSRGLENKSTKHHKDIIDLINKNISQIKKCLSKTKKQQLDAA